MNQALIIAAYNEWKVADDLRRVEARRKAAEERMLPLEKAAIKLLSEAYGRPPWKKSDVEMFCRAICRALEQYLESIPELRFPLSMKVLCLILENDDFCHLLLQRVKGEKAHGKRMRNEMRSEIMQQEIRVEIGAKVLTHVIYERLAEDDDCYFCNPKSGRRKK